MSSDTSPSSLGVRIERLAVDLAWAQWSVLTPLVSAPAAPAHAIIDPEALVILSLIGARHEQRLLDVVAAWFSAGISLVSVQRARSLAARLPQSQRDLLNRIAGLAGDAGDHRWKRYSTTSGAAVQTPARAKSAGPLRLDAPPALLFRLRAGFGAGTKADALAMLLGMDHPVTLRAIANGLNYGVRPLRVALGDMVAAGFVEEIGSKPTTYRASAEQWGSVLNGGRHEVPANSEYPPRWRPWADVTILLAHVLEWADETKSAGWSDYITTSRLRDVVDHHVTPAIASAMHLLTPDAGQQWDYRALENLIEGVERFTRAEW